MPEARTTNNIVKLGLGDDGDEVNDEEEQPTVTKHQRRSEKSKESMAAAAQLGKKAARLFKGRAGSRLCTAFYEGLEGGPPGHVRAPLEPLVYSNSLSAFAVQVACKDSVITCVLKNEHKLLSAAICAILAMHSQRV
jgi:hypothetical protein